ncbi:MAG: hypothetical protein ROO73_05550 [Roseivirga sp.]
MEQVRRKEYRTPYAQVGKALLVMGINFSSEARDINDWKGEWFGETGRRTFVPTLEENTMH